MASLSREATNVERKKLAVDMEQLIVAMSDSQGTQNLWFSRY